MVLKILTVLLLLVTGFRAQDCNDPSGLTGTCTPIQECQPVMLEYDSRKDDPKYLDFLRQSHVNCRLVKQNICCPVASTDDVAPRFLVETPSGNCQDLYNVPGDCKDIKQCPHIIAELSRRQGDAEFANYLRDSNRRCHSVNRNICCTFPTTTPATQSADLETTLPTPGTGCGYSAVTHNKVVGGVPAELGAWPWMALLGYANRLGEISFKCGGSLITSRHVLTAAHCLRNNLEVVRFGEHDQSIETETSTVDIRVKRSVGHPKYDRKDGNSDVAVVTLVSTVQFTSKISPVCLPIAPPELTRNYEGYSPFVAGWGHTQEGGTSADVLQELQIPVLPNAECVRRYGDANKLISPKQFDNKVLCAGVLEGGKDSCQGDSGGPLMSPVTINSKDYYYQIGIVSYGIGCARVNIPGVYARVQSFIPWIMERVKEI